MDKLLTAEDAGDILRVTPDQIYRYIKASLLECERFPTGQIRITEEQIKKFLAKKTIEKKT